MKKLLVLLFLLQAVQASAQEKRAGAPPEIDQYWFVMIRTGPNVGLDSAERAELFRGHMSNMQRLADEGILKIAGPFGKNDLNWRGIFILDCKTLKEAQQHVDTDPAVNAGLFEVDIVPWYSSPDGNLRHTKKD